MTPTGRAGRAGGHRWAALAFTSLAVSLVVLDATVVNVALPVLIDDLRLTAPEAFWVSTSYAVVLAALLVNLGRAADRFGRRRVLVAGLAWFGVASLLASRASSTQMLLAARVLQGIGAAAILPATLSTTSAIFTGRARSIAFGVWGSVIGGMAAVGPLLGGWLTTDYSWRRIFDINVPLCVVAVVGVLTFVPETRDPASGRGVDVVGSVLAAIGAGALVVGLVEGETYGWFRPRGDLHVLGVGWPSRAVSAPFVALALASTASAAFVAVERRRARHARTVLLDPALFRIPSFRAGNVTALIVSMGQYGLLLTVPLFLQSVAGYTPLRTGVVVATLAVGAFATGPIAAPLTLRIGPRAVVGGGIVLEMVGAALVGLRIAVDARGAELVPGLVVYGLGLGLASAQLTSASLLDVPAHQAGQASGVQSTTRQLGSALGTATLGTILAVSLGSLTSARLAADSSITDTQRSTISSAVRSSVGQVIPHLASGPGGPATVAAASEAFVGAVQRVAGGACAVLLLGLVASRWLPKRAPARSSLSDDPARSHASILTRR